MKYSRLVSLINSIEDYAHHKAYFQRAYFLEYSDEEMAEVDDLKELAKEAEEELKKFGVEFD